jgi:putative chitinase
MLTMPCPRCWQRPREVPCDLCSGSGRVADQELAPHYLLSECLASPTALRGGIPNDPTATIVDHLRESAGNLWEPVRLLLGVPVHVNSGYRSPSLNAATPGSSNTSAHCQGYAIDCKPLGMPLADAMRRIVGSALEYDQAIYEFGSWIHLGWRGPGGRQLRQALMIFEPGRYRPWDPNDARVGG